MTEDGNNLVSFICGIQAHCAGTNDILTDKIIHEKLKEIS
jgi:hypothetical protein